MDATRKYSIRLSPPERCEAALPPLFVIDSLGQGIHSFEVDAVSRWAVLQKKWVPPAAAAAAAAAAAEMKILTGLVRFLYFLYICISFLA